LRCDHREQTHWLLVGITLAIVAGIATAEVIPFVASPPPWLPAAIMVGFVTGYWMHSFADACTIDKGGIALLAPIFKCGFHLVPASWRIRVFEVKRDAKGHEISRRPSDGDKRWRVGAHAVVVAIVLLVVVPSVAPWIMRTGAFAKGRPATRSQSHDPGAHHHPRHHHVPAGRQPRHTDGSS
jgi:LexA-binding, inner membrane-associated putative hydrolase